MYGHVKNVFTQCAPARAGVQARLKISFGKMLAAKMGGDAGMANTIDAVVEQDYRTNL